AAPLTGQDDAYRGIRTTLFSFYGQDDWKVRSNFTLNLGLRYEFITSPTEVNDKLANVRDVLNDAEPTIGSPFFENNSLKDFGPRLGFAWDIFGDGRTSLRGGYGIYYAQLFPANYRFEMSNQPPFFLIGLAFFPGTVEDVFDRLANIPGIVALQTFEFEPEPSYVQQWNLSFQRELFYGTTATVAYVGSRGVHLTTNANRNTSANFTVDSMGKLFPPGRNPLRNPAFGAIRAVLLNGDSYYNALQINVARRFARGLQFQMAYTYSKSIDTASDAAGIFQYEQGQLPQDPYDLRNDRGLSAFDLRNIFSLNIIYDLPYQTQSGATGGRKVADFILGGWQVNSIITAQSGTPFNPTISFNNSNDGNTDNVERPSWAPGATPESAVTGDPNRYFRPEAFVVAPPGRFGNVARNALIGPGLATVDLSLIKSNKVGERLTVEFRAEAFNLLNRANFALPAPEAIDVFTGRAADGSGVVPPNAGAITSTATTSRQLQFGLKFIF
ncbi:MAG TPA: TonB-dependent receptor, partial [Blastocatellia bacterium]|nr:TonB-dependent receptor [Blastocatellia bacterium]